MIVKRDRSQCIYVSSSVTYRVVYGKRAGDTCAGDFRDLAHRKFVGVRHFSRMWILVWGFLSACSIISHAFCSQD